VALLESVMSNRGSVRSRSLAITSGGVRRSIGTTMPPASQTPNMLATSSGELAASTSTRSPGPMPAPASVAAANRAARTSW
jgi:hypothetical protein